MRSRGNRFDDVVKLEHVKQALMQLRFKARAARAAAEAACAHGGSGADVGTIVTVALELERQRTAHEGRAPRVPAERVMAHDAENTDVAAREVERFDVATQNAADAKQALVQLGYPPTVAAAAVHSARAHVGVDTDLATLIKESHRRC
jgi:Holliday junction resolvasome RuvABC DNA-binding subunit